MANLFREEALLRKTGAIFGGVIVDSRSAGTVIACIAVLLSAGLLLLLVCGTYSSKEQVIGYLTPRAGLAEIYSPRVGVITRIEVSEGESVRTGDRLFLVASPRDTGSGLDVDQIHMARLREEWTSIESQIANEEALTKERINVAKRRISEVGRQVETAQKQLKNALDGLELAKHEVRRLETLQQASLVSESMLDSGKRGVLDAWQSVQTLEREIETLESGIASLQSELNQIPLQMGVRRSELRSRLFDLQGKLAEVQANREVVVRATIDGRISGFMAHVGMAVTPERSVLSIIPRGSLLQAELLVPTHAAGFLRQGQEVRLRYDAFPYQKFGLYRGKISSISRTVSHPEDQVGPTRLSVPAYRVIAGLESQYVSAYGSELPLQPGLTLRADIVRDRRRIVEWILDPLFAAVKGI